MRIARGRAWSTSTTPILATVDVTPGKLALGESQAGPQTRRLTIKNRGGSAVTLMPTHVAALASGPKNPNNFATISTLTAFASAAFSAPSVTVPAGATRTLDVTITAPNRRRSQTSASTAGMSY